MKLRLLIEASRMSALESAVKNRRRIKFYYAGPRSGKDSVKAGSRYEVEPVAIGLTKKGNMAIRGWVNNTSSVTKTGFEKGQWRTFLVSRFHMLDITDEVFNEKRPGYKEGDDGSFSVTYTTSDWEKKPYKRKFEKELSRRQRKAKELELQKQVAGVAPVAAPPVEPGVEPSAEPTALPEPKAQEKPTVEPVNVPQAPPPPTPDIPEPETDPEVDSDFEQEEIPDEEENLQLHETIKKIKHLMFY